MDALRRLDHGSFTAFAAAARTLNFTLAAEKAALTQSGVSQHVARLERQLGAQLFTRINRKVRLTKAGEILLRFIERQSERTEALFEELHGETSRVRGKVRYGMPHSCLFTPHFALLLDKRKAGFEEVELEVSLCPNDAVLEKLLGRRIDFGFVTRKESNPAIGFELFCREEYILVAGRARGTRAPLRAEALLGEKFVAYPGMKVLFDIWAEHHFKKRPLAYDSLTMAGSIESLHGAITMLEHGVGASVVPRHCVQDLLKSGKLREVPGPNARPLLNDVFLVALNGVGLPRRVRVVLDAFRAMRS